ncbi:YtxH domain-containing protein [Eisenibacter elegans]|uniref:YtxH domain-containing protein n=1 Tax=Eisenibacter elegans TaxID=997 RepID=UPI00041CFD17|nr:YtxH domain-containing protein [Eisenibacter elegans]
MSNQEGNGSGRVLWGFLAGFFAGVTAGVLLASDERKALIREKVTDLGNTLSQELNKNLDKINESLRQQIDHNTAASAQDQNNNQEQA